MVICLLTKFKGAIEFRSWMLTLKKIHLHGYFLPKANLITVFIMTSFYRTAKSGISMFASIAYN